MVSIPIKNMKWRIYSKLRLHLKKHLLFLNNPETIDYFDRYID